MKDVVYLHIRNLIRSQNSLPVREKARLINGKFRRLLLGILAKKYIAEMEKHRVGECIRCGTCCKLLYDCPFLEYDENGLAVCSIHEESPLSCRIFPATPADIEDRNAVEPSCKCGFSFLPEACQLSLNARLRRALVKLSKNCNRKKP